MLILNLGNVEVWDPLENLFSRTEDRIVKLEHSLYSIAQWESKWRKPFLVQEAKTEEEMISYIELMVVEGDMDVDLLTVDHLNEIAKYMETDMSATTVRNLETGGSGMIITSEVMYAQMCNGQVNWEAQYWHFSRLNKLLRVLSEMNSEKKKMDKRDVLKQNHELNEQRKREMKSKG